VVSRVPSLALPSLFVNSIIILALDFSPSSSLRPPSPLWHFPSATFLQFEDFCPLDGLVEEEVPSVVSWGPSSFLGFSPTPPTSNLPSHFALIPCSRCVRLAAFLAPANSFQFSKCPLLPPHKAPSPPPGRPPPLSGPGASYYNLYSGLVI